ncbi:TlpA family protein disulfide reductase [Ferroacidibacillus organovorans]|uniref:Thioredoxin domain-containing protein n=1 Tax=Ferroacidibacillus organovorans TaxID=1765683 RepID=A0A853KGR3_9BACL|nr:TlpA disulfide reductase family protein [Ferroacidibacillus organovorans]KYP79922.1 hypothetical protein AYJ22_03220 [Ferroacidibacillus organovorans]OAG94600.1 hypothetical protein AYW79_04395 [Ferroacidibacillus organovorans]
MHKVPRRNIIIFSVAAIVAGILGYYLWQYGKYVTPAKIGDITPDIKAVTVTGQSFELKNLQGDPVFLNFFTPWCPPCIQETPDLIAFAKQYGKRIHVVLIDRGDDSVLVRNYVSKYHIPSEMTVLLSSTDHWSPPYGVTGQPETFLISSNGRIVKHIIGPLTEAQMVQYAKEAGMKNP